MVMLIDIIILVDLNGNNKMEKYKHYNMMKINIYLNK